MPADEAEARAVQDALRSRVVLDEPGPPSGTGRVTGVDVAYDDERDVVVAAAVVLDEATLDVVAETTAVGRISFPYIPGLLAFREIPTVLAALESLPVDPGLVICDGYGLAHPRRFGLASHLGVLTGLQVIGVAKNPFTFSYERPGPAGATGRRCSTARRRWAGHCVPRKASSRSSSPSDTGPAWTTPAPTPCCWPATSVSRRPPAGPTHSAARPCGKRPPERSPEYAYG